MAPTSDHVCEQMCRDLTELAERCRSGDATADDLDRLANAYRAVHGVPVRWGQQERQQLAVRIVAAWLRGLRNPSLSPELFEDGIASIPHWLAHLCDEPAFANAVIDKRVREIVKRTYPGKPERGARQLVALFAMRTGAWGLDAFGCAPDWYDADKLKEFADRNLWAKPTARAKKPATWP